MDSDNIVVLENTLKYLSLHFIFPKVNDINNPPKIFYFKFIAFNLSASMFLIGPLLHLIVNIRRQTYIDMDLDIALIISLSGACFFNFVFFVKVKNTIKLYKQLSDFDSYGVPTNYEATNRTLNYLSKCQYVYVSFAILIAGLTPFHEYGKCEEQNVQKNINEICGLLGSVWYPFDLDKFPRKQIYYLYQMYSATVLYHTASDASWAIIETIEHIILRLRHVSNLFTEALTEKNYLASRKKFNKAVEYHISVIGMVKLLNKSFSVSMTVHVLLTAAVLGCLEEILTQRFSFIALCVLIGWATAMIVSCISGQRLLNESLAIGENIWKLDWYNLDIRIQKDLVMVIRACQKPMYLTAGPFGYMFYGTIISVLKASYSYLTLLSET